jgi:hypothetical protein
MICEQRKRAVGNSSRSRIGRSGVARSMEIDPPGRARRRSITAQPDASDLGKAVTASIKMPADSMTPLAIHTSPDKKQRDPETIIGDSGDQIS